MSDDAVDYGSSSDSDSESDKVPSRLPARAESCILAHDLSVLHAGFGCEPSSSSPEQTSIGVCDAIFCDPSTSDRASAESSSRSDTADAGAVSLAADDGDYELEERSAGNTPRRRFGPFFLGCQ